MKKLSYLFVAFFFVFSVFYEVKANADTDCITSAGSQTCQLSGDIEVSQPLLVQGQVELDLNGHTITVTSEASISGGIIQVKRGASLVIKDTAGNGAITVGENTKVYAAVQVTASGESGTGPKATLTVEGGMLKGYYYAIVGNGSRHNTEITVNGGTLTTLSATGTGIYHPQEGTLTINGGTITSGTGIEMRSGNLVVNGGTITGTATPTSVTPNGNGTTTTGAGVAIAQHTTLKDISVKIKGGTIKGYSAVYESNPQENANIANQVSVSISGGTFEAINGGEAVVYSEDLTGFVTRGTFNKSLGTSYVAQDAPIKEVDGKYVIGLDNGTGIESDTNYDIPTAYDSEIYVAPVEVYDVNLSWDDMHWVFVYEGDITNPARKVWVTKEAYNTIKDENNLENNELNGHILDSVDDLEQPTVSISVENKSSFAVDVSASIAQKNNVQNYTNPAGLEIAVDLGNNSEFGSQATANGVLTNASTKLLVMPKATRYVNNDGAPATVAGEVVLTFAKTN